MNTVKTAMTQSIALLNNTTVTVVETKKGGWTSIQLSDGSMKNVRTNQLDFNATVLQSTTEANTMESFDDMLNTINPAEDVIMDFSEIFAAVSAEFEQDANSASQDYIATCVANMEAEAAKAATAELNYVVSKALGFINATKVLKEVGIASLEGRQILRGILEYSRSFKRLAKFRAATPVNTAVENYRVTVAKYMEDTLEFYSHVNNLGSELVNEFNWGIQNITNVFRCLTDDEIKGSKSYSDKNLDLEYVAPIDQPVRVAVRYGAVVLTAKAGTIIEYTNGTKFVINADRSVGITSADVKAGVLNTMSKITFHNERTKTDDNGKVEYFFDENATNITGSIFNKIFMVKSNKLNLDKLLDDKTGMKSKVVAIKLNGKLEDLPYPAHNLFNVYGRRSGMVSLQEAKSGYIVDINNVRALIEFKDGVALSIENINKAIARADKQEKDNGWSAGTWKVFVAYDLTTGLTPVANEVLGTGCIFMPEIFFDRYGLSRVTSRMFRGGVKAATHFDSDFEAAYPNCGLVGPSAFKGGFLGLLALLGKEFESLAVFANGNTAGAALVDGLQSRVEANLQTVKFQGEEVKGLWVNIPLQITNAIMVEQYQWAGEKDDNDSILERASNLANILSVPNGFRDHAMSLATADESFSMVDYIQQGLEDEIIVEKANITRHTASLFQTAVMWGGPSKVTKLINAVIKSMPKGRAGKVLAAQYLTANYDIVARVDAKDIANLMINAAEEYSTELLLDVATYPLALRSGILGLFQHDAETKTAQWVEINFNGTKICVPTHNFFYNPNQAIETSKSFVATGFIKEVLESVKRAINVKADETSVTYSVQANKLNGEGKFLQAKLQSRLLGKNFGHLYTVGTYQLMLPSLNRDIEVYEVEVTDGTMFMPVNENGTTSVFPGSLKVNGVKYPAYFEDAFAGYVMFETDMGSDIVNFAMRKACFMNVETIMIMQNDCDGDLHQFTNDGFHLPLYVGPRGQFNQASFLKFLEDEAAGNTLRKLRKLHETSMEDFQAAIFAAGNAKDNIGKYTATKYVYETVLQGVENFVTTTGNIVEVNGKLRHRIISTLSYLCQVEAMDNIKQNADGSVIENILDMVAVSRLSNFKDFGTKTAEQHRNAALKAIKTRLAKFFVVEGWDVDMDLADVTAEALYYCANLKKSNATPAYNIFNARVNNEKRFEALALELSGEKVEESFNYEGAYASSIDGIDSRSMYAYVLKALVRHFGNV